MAENGVKAEKRVRVWYDAEGDYLEVILDQETPGYFRETANDQVMEKVDERKYPRFLNPQGQLDQADSTRGRSLRTADVVGTRAGPRDPRQAAISHGDFR